MKIFFIKNQKGYAILFAVVIVSAISVITAGLSNAAYKQQILSSLSKDSQIAFYQADTASDCALYADRIELPYLTQGNTWPCGDLKLTFTGTSDSYTLFPVEKENSLDPCFRITVTKNPNWVDPDEKIVTKTTISAKGYNFCKKNIKRTVEREIEINYY